MKKLFILVCLYTTVSIANFNIDKYVQKTKDMVTVVTPRIEKFDNVVDRLNSFCDDVVVLYSSRIINQYDVQLVLDSMVFAAERHKNTTRKDAHRTPGIIHPIEVAKNLIEVGGITEPCLISTCLLHDTIEDSETTGFEIASRFGEYIASLVNLVTVDKTIPKADRKQKTVIKMKTVPEDVVIITLVDKYSNLGNLEEIPPSKWLAEDPDRLARYFAWVNEIASASSETRRNKDLRKAIFKKFVAFKNGKSPAAQAVAKAKEKLKNK